MSTVQKSNALFSRRAVTEFSSGAARSARGAGAEDRVFSLFQPDILVSTQYLATTKSHTQRDPEQRLMLAVLEDAVWCFQNGLASKDKRKQGLSADAEQWIMEETPDWLFSFSEICELLGIEARYLRKHLLSWKEHALEARAQKHKGTRSNQRSKANARPGQKRHRYLHAAGF